MPSNQFIEWSDATMSIGIREIDDQHKVLVKLLNDLHHGICERKASEECGAVLEQLIEYTRVHFATEEAVMSVLKYPGLEAHRKEHYELINQVAEFKARFDAGKANISFEVLHFLKNWLTKHIIGTDKEAGAFIIEQGRVRQFSWWQRLSLRDLFR